MSRSPTPSPLMTACSRSGSCRCFVTWNDAATFIMMFQDHTNTTTSPPNIWCPLLVADVALCYWHRSNRTKKVFRFGAQPCFTVTHTDPVLAFTCILTCSSFSVSITSLSQHICVILSPVHARQKPPHASTAASSACVQIFWSCHVSSAYIYISILSVCVRLFVCLLDRLASSSPCQQSVVFLLAGLTLRHVKRATGKKRQVNSRFPWAGPQYWEHLGVKQLIFTF